ncbi:MAG: EamA family transporter [Actinomycetota bacterium]|nr:EamA family transporter [Actinomycetota bacterium]
MRLGYAFAATAAALWALNASIGSTLMDRGLGWPAVSQLRVSGSFVLLAAALALVRRDLLRVERSAVPELAVLGFAALAPVQATYFLAIDRLEIGTAVTIQYLAPLIVLLWLKLWLKRQIASGLWGAVALSVVGCFFVVRAYDAGALDPVGVGAAFASALTFAGYMVLSERAGRHHSPFTTLAWGFGFASLAWAVAQPWWLFPYDELGSARDALLAAGVVVVGTLLPFLAMVAALRLIPSPRAGVVATLEPVLAAVFAWVLVGEALAALQVGGMALVVVAVVWVQSHRPDLEAEAAPGALTGRS